MPDMHANKKTNEIDVYLGSRIKSCRLMLNKSQEELAQAMGISFQQVQKYEKGINRVTVSRLLSISSALNAPLEYFIDKNLLKVAEEPSRLEDEPVLPMSTDILALIRAYGRIEDPRIRTQVLSMTKALSKK